METAKDVTLCTLIGLVMVSAASVGIFCATLGMCALATLGVLLE